MDGLRSIGLVVLSLLVSSAFFFQTGIVVNVNIASILAMLFIVF